MMFNLVSDVAMQGGPSWRDNRTHWRDIETYDLAVGPKSGGRLFPGTDERPDKVRKLGQLTRAEVASEVYGSEAQEEDDDFLPVIDSKEKFEDVDNLNDVYGSKCYLAVYSKDVSCALATEDEQLEWFDFLPAFVGLRRSTAQKYGVSVKELRLKKRRPPYGAQKKHNRAQSKRWCDMHL